MLCFDTLLQVLILKTVTGAVCWRKGNWVGAEDFEGVRRTAWRADMVRRVGKNRAPTQPPHYNILVLYVKDYFKFKVLNGLRRGDYSRGQVISSGRWSERGKGRAHPRRNRKIEWPLSEAQELAAMSQTIALRRLRREIVFRVSGSETTE